ncbi:hypothetical protein [Paracerasibacillus soli]|uniref:Uncharacterized protein n=1 Tax=Paracerasibacillus soli TaxID=480284 RepID=A0ABU5CSR1_9BACI|nr:hypothetical protein [Virgibacillus soli]MDY0408854.1 hypothetical protein [Virgibacillus soli]
MMKRMLIFCFITIIITACNNSPEFINRAVHNENFINTIESYLFSDSDSSVIEINSQFEEQSNIMVNAVKLHVPEVDSLNYGESSCKQQESNLLYCKVLLTRLLNQSVFERDELQSSSYFDTYFMYVALEENGAMEDLSTLLDSVQENPVPTKNNTIEYYYYVIMDFIINDKIHDDVEDEVISIIEDYRSSYIIDYDEPIILHAALVLSRLYELNVDLSLVKEIYSDHINQTLVLLRDEITFYVHLEVVSEMNKQLDEKLVMEIISNQPVYQTYYYSLDSLRNLYLLSNILPSQDLKDYEVYIGLIQHRLGSILEENGNEIKQSYQQSYFLQQASLNVGYKGIEDYLIVGDGACDNVSPLIEEYYCLKLFNLHSGNQIKINHDDLLEKVTLYDMLERNDANKQEILGLYNEVLSSTEENFYVILNTYLNLLISYDIEFNENDFIDKISSFECEIGYCTEIGNYDFEMSLYFNNILNLLKGDKNAEGFR